MRVGAVAALAAAVACTTPATDARRDVAASTSPTSVGAASPVTSSGAPTSTPAAAATTGATPPASPVAPPTATASGAAYPVDSRCRTPKYRCVALAEAVAWWGGKPGLVPREGTASLRAMLHAPSDDAAARSDDAAYPPSFTYVLPDRLFPAMTAKRGGISATARAGGIVVRTYFVTGRWLPERDDRVSHGATVRGREAIVSEFRTSDTSSVLRDVKWWVPHGDGTYVLWLVEDDAADRSEAALLAIVNALGET